MNVLLDTCALLALAGGCLPAKAAKILSNAEEATVPAVVVWELAIKVKSGKISLPEHPLEWIEAVCTHHSLDLQRQLTDISLLCAAADLPLIHRDPFDRVIIATALGRGHCILTSDRIIPTYPGVKTTWTG